MESKRILDAIISSKPINKGWSEDKKYCVTTNTGTKYLLRVTPIYFYEARKSLFAMLERVAALDIPMCKPVGFGTCDGNDLFQGGVYSIQSWIDGEDLETALPLLSEPEQYVLGLKSGDILKKIHSIPVQETQEEWSAKFGREIDEKIREYHKCGLYFDGDGCVIDYIEKNRHLLINRPQCYGFDDYNILNMMLENGGLRIIDFERFYIGDPWEEFSDIVWSATASPHFATGQIRGYFGGEPPMEFFELLAIYIPMLLLSLISSWAITSEFGRDVTMKLSKNILKWFDNMKNPVPTWYLKGYEIWDVLDANSNKTGRYHERGKPMSKGEHHLEVSVWIENDRGEYLISKRSQNKTFPNMWECTGGNAVAGDDSLTTALKETKEELGIILEQQNGRVIQHHLPCSTIECHGLIDVWLFRQNVDISTVILAPDEVCDAMWASAGKVKEMMASGELLEYPYFDEMVETWRRL